MAKSIITFKASSHSKQNRDHREFKRVKIETSETWKEKGVTSGKITGISCRLFN